MKNKTQKLTSPIALILVWVIGYLIAIPAWQRLQPATNWLDVASIRINSGFQGEDYSMVVDRELTLDRPTRGVWVAKLVNERNEVVCTNDGTALYTPTARLPGPQTLKLFGWWMDAGRVGGADRICLEWPLPPGEYCLKTFWEFFPANYPASKHLDAPTACFLVLRKPWYLHRVIRSPVSG